MPSMISETSAKRDIDGRAQGMDETRDAVRSLREAGIPVKGYAWFPLFTMIAWAYRKSRHPIQDSLLHLGLYDSTFDSKGILRRHTPSLVKRYRQHIGNPMPSIGN